MLLAIDISLLLLLGLCGTGLLIAVIVGKNPLAEAPRQARWLTVAFLLVYFTLETLDVLQRPSGAPRLVNAWAVFGLVMGLLASLLMLRGRPPSK